MSDPENAYASKLGLTFTLSENLRQLYSSLGILLPEFNGEASWTLPVPTRLVANAEGVVVRIDADPDYTRRPEPETTLEALKNL